MKEIMSLRRQVRIIVESHTAFTHDFTGSSLLRRIRNHFFLNTLKKCDLLIALTAGDAACWKQHIAHVVSVPNAVSFYSEEISLQSRVPGRIIAVGRYHPQKRFDRLIDAFTLISDKYPQWHICIFGEGPDKDTLQQQIDSLGLHERIHLMPSTKDIMTEYLKSEMFVLSSDYEGFGLVLAEAMACGVPVVAFDCENGPRSIITDGVDGFLIPPFDIDAFAEKVILLMNDDELRKKMGENAQKSSFRYDIERVGHEWRQLFDEQKANLIKAHVSICQVP
jgi:glycosyltransferase involved in cell wall biosynthesis